MVSKTSLDCGVKKKSGGGKNFSGTQTRPAAHTHTNRCREVRLWAVWRVLGTSKSSAKTGQNTLSQIPRKHQPAPRKVAPKEKKNGRLQLGVGREIIRQKTGKREIEKRRNNNFNCKGKGVLIVGKRVPREEEHGQERLVHGGKKGGCERRRSLKRD